MMPMDEQMTMNVDIVAHLREALTGLMRVEQITVHDTHVRPLVTFGGHLAPGDQDEIFDEILARFNRLGYTPMLRGEDGLHLLQAAPIVIKSKTGRPVVNLVLFVFTVLSVLLIGAQRENVDVLSHPAQIWRGWPFAVTILGILTAHELSHYFVGRRYGSPVSLPYFIPMPLSILGTMGAVIVQKGPMRSRKALFDIGIAGPIGGLVLAVPLLFIGLAFSYVGSPREFMDLPPGAPVPVMQEGNSLLYLAAKYVIHGRLLPDPKTGEDVWLSPPSPGGSIAFAAWAGLLVTALNLFPIGQFDGGHVAYALWGRKAWRLAGGFLVLIFAWSLVLMLLGNQASSTWFTWGLMGLLIRPRHPPPLNDLTPVDRKRRILGWVMVGVFLLILTPVPLVETVIR